MTRTQKGFYHFLESELRRGGHPDVQGSISYLFAYTYGVLSRWEAGGFDGVYDALVDIGEAYHREEYFSQCCLSWSYDCLLAQGKFDEYLERSEPSDIFGTALGESSTRLNVQYHLGMSASAVDLHKMGGGQATTIARRSAGLFREMLEETYREAETEHGSWFDRMLREVRGRGTWSMTLFKGALIKQPPVGFPSWYFTLAGQTRAAMKACSRRAENGLREKLGLPEIGEGWVAETALFEAVKAAFSQTSVILHGRPPWLGGQHFDIWFPRWRIAVEYHGQQHFHPIDFFGDEDAIRKTQERDRRKQKLCRRHGATLIIVTEEHSQPM